MSKYLEAVLVAQEQGLISRQSAKELVADEVIDSKIKAAFDAFKTANII